MMRREFIALFAGSAVAGPLTARGQSVGTPRLGVLGNENTPPWESFRQGLRDLGYDDGRNVTIEWRWSQGQADRFPFLAKELVGQNVDLIVTSATQATRAAKQATATIPIVMALSSYPEKLGLVESLARPGGNVTGLSQLAPELLGKRLELCKEIVPKIARIAVLWNPSSPIEPWGFQEVLAAAATLGIKIESVEVRNPDEFSTALSRIASNRPDALYVFGNPPNFTARTLIVRFATENRLPTVFEERLFVQAGGLLSYAPSFSDLFRRAATYVDKILKGAKPAELPVELPTKFELVINLKTAKALGLEVPATLLARADEVIE